MKAEDSQLVHRFSNQNSYLNWLDFYLGESQLLLRF